MHHFDRLQKLLLACCCVLFCPSIRATAQVAELGFPVTAFAAADEPNRLLAIGGHDVALLSADDLRIVRQISLDDVRVADARILPAKYSRNTGKGTAVLIAGTIDSEDGYVALHTFEDQSAAWQHFDLSAPIVSMCLVGTKCLVGDDEGQISAYNVQSGQLLWSEQVHSKMVTSIATITPGLCASSDWGGKIVLFDPASGLEQTNFQQHQARVSKLVADSSGGLPRLYSCGRDGTVRLWYPTQSRLVRFANLGKPLTAMAILSDGMAVVATSGAALYNVDMNTAKVIAKTESSHAYVHALFTLDDDHVIGSDGRQKIFRLDVRQ